VNDVAIRIEGLGKMYRIGGPQERYHTLRDTLTDAVSAPFRRARSLLRGQAYGAAGLHEIIWALRDVSFEVKHGDVVGIIGRNGAGKSTLLKVLSRITEPTEGYADVYGRVGALLEVGTGFHPELTGRENIYLNGAILGMTREEINRKFDEIVDFAEVEKFIDTPVKHYSSGMGLRLGFAVAAHLEPEILVVDEVLAVGDAQFQKKCLGKMSDVAREGRTVLFVSHNMAAVESLCGRVIRLNEGSISDDGSPHEVISKYLNSMLTESVHRVWDDRETAPGNEKVRIHRATVRPTDGQPGDIISMLTPLTVEYEYWNLRPRALLNLSLHVFNEKGVMVFNTAPVHETEWNGKPFEQGLYASSVRIPGHLLNSGLYHIELLVVEDQSRIIFRMDSSVVFDVVDSPETRGNTVWFGNWPGALHPYLEWETKLVSDAV
jgi:lipopolysaccharide transport system ATP-binding protein